MKFNSIRIIKQDTDLTKKKVKKRIEEHKSDVRTGREAAANAKIAPNENNKINYNKT